MGSESPSTVSGLLATVVAVAIGTLVVYPLKDVAPAVSLGSARKTVGATRNETVTSAPTHAASAV